VARCTCASPGDGRRACRYRRRAGRGWPGGQLYSFTSKPPTLEALAAAGKLNNAFFGCSAAQFGADFRAEYRAFVEGYDSWDKTIRPSAFFRSKEDIWPRLSRVARFWLEFEFSSISVERDFDLARAAAARAIVEEIDQALAKIPKKTYGICETSGLAIPKERLRAIPWARERVEVKTRAFG
jgi:hypothetical protein